MILVDTSVWAAFFNGADERQVIRLDEALTAAEEIVTTPIVVTETLQGFRTDAGFAKARRLLERLPCLSLDLDGNVEAASLYRRLRRRGIAVRGAVDCIIAQTAIVHGAELLARDGDFERIAAACPLRLTPVSGS